MSLMLEQHENDNYYYDIYYFLPEKIVLFFPELIVTDFNSFVPHFFFTYVRVQKYVFMRLTESHIIDTDIEGSSKVMDFTISPK